MMLCDALVTRESISISLFSHLAQTDFQSSLCNLCMHPLCCHHNVERSFQLEVDASREGASMSVGRDRGGNC